jgi:hypothetical protein
LDVPLEENDVVSFVRRGSRRIPWRALLRFPHGQDGTKDRTRQRTGSPNRTEKPDGGEPSHYAQPASNAAASWDANAGPSFTRA